MKKRCSKCGERYPATTEFFHRKQCKKDKLDSYCKKCRKIITREWESSNREKTKKIYRNKELKRRYGIDQEKYEEMLLQQNNRCAICSEVSKNTLSVDHDHSDGRVRGLLCNDCNRMLGAAKDKIEVLLAAIEYLKKGLEMKTSSKTNVAKKFGEQLLKI